MDSLLPSSDPTAGKAASFTSGLLSSLSSLFGANAANADVFANLLASDPALPPIPPPQQPMPPSSSSSPSSQDTESTNNDGENTDNGVTSGVAALQAMIAGLHRIVDHIKRQESKNDTADSGTSTGNTNSPAAANTPAAPAPTTVGVTGVNNVSSTDTADDNSNDTTAAAPSVLSNIVAVLTDLMKVMEQKLQAAQQAAATNATTATMQLAGSNTGNPSSSDPLTQLLTLLQTLQQQLTVTAASALASASSSTTAGGSSSTTPASSPVKDALQDLAQLQQDLKGLMSSLQAAGANSNPATGNLSNTASNNAPAVSTDGSTDSANTAGADRPSLGAQDSLFDMFGSFFGNAFVSAPPANYAPANASVMAAVTEPTENSSSDTAPQDNGTLSSDSGSTGLSGLSANLTALSGMADGTKPADPYAFASQLSALRAANGGTVGLPDAIEQVILQINHGVKDGDDQMSIQLHPAELGKINVKLDISSDGQVRGTVVADNPSTLSMLHKDVRSLERALQEAGLRANPGSLQFSLSGQSGNSSGQTAANADSNGAPRNINTDDTSSATALDIPVAADETYYITPGRVNFKV
jgi:hypothetical protein